MLSNFLKLASLKEKNNFMMFKKLQAQQGATQLHGTRPGKGVVSDHGRPWHFI